jgi:hypothetical protein
MAEIPTLQLKGPDGSTVTLYRYGDGTVGLFLDDEAKVGATASVVLEPADLAPIAAFLTETEAQFLDGNPEVPC